MVEILLLLTLLAAGSTAVLLALFLMRSRSAEREARQELSQGLATFSQTLTAQMGSIAGVQNAQFETLRGAVEQRLERIQQDNTAKLDQMRQTVDEKLHATLEKRLSESFKQVSERLELVHKGWARCRPSPPGWATSSACCPTSRRAACSAKRSSPRCSSR
jgi:DNA anti-recombination protein RmuC